MSLLVITVARTGSQRPSVSIAAPGVTERRTLDGVDEHRLGDVLRQLDRIVTGSDGVGPCERFIATLHCDDQAAA